MKTTMKMIFAAILALTMITSLGTCAFADYGFWTPNGYCVDHENGIVTIYYDDGTTETVNNNIGSRTYGDYDGSYSVTEGNYIYHFDRFGNLTGVQVFNGSWYETVWGC